MNKKILYVIACILVLLAAWYFFVKEHDYQISFESKNPKGFVYSNIMAWNNNRPIKDTIVKTTSTTPYNTIEQEYYPVNDSTIYIKWELNKINDSITKVKGYFKSEDSSPVLRTKLLFASTDFVTQSLDFSRGLNRRIRSRSKLYKLSPVDTITIPSNKYLYIDCNATVKTKAKMMIANNGYILKYFKENDIELAGFPFVEVRSWDKQTDSIRFKFCFPIKEVHSSNVSSIKYEERPSFKALRIRYNGNYSKSHLAWYAYSDYFEQIDADAEILPTEFFFDDPNQGGEDIEWRADIVLPLNQINK